MTSSPSPKIAQESNTSNQESNQEIRNRAVVSEHSSQVNEQHQPLITTASNENSQQPQVENSITRKSTYLIVTISVTIAFLLFRRIFLL